MKVFISWSGARSQALAEALRDWLPLVLHYAEPWLSKSDIQSGERWGIEVAKELQETNFGIICVTKDNLTSPWILFEAGALAKSMDGGRVTPLLLDLDFKEISGPLAQFQAKKVEKVGLKELIQDLNKSAPTPMPEERLNHLFDPLYGTLEVKIADIPPIGSAPKQTRPQGEILEELVSSVRNVEMRVRDAMDEESGGRKRYRRRLSPGLIMDVTHSISDGAKDPIQILVFFSLFKDEMPWLYELALDLYRALSAGNRAKAAKARSKLKRALEVTQRGPFFEGFGPDGRMMYMMLEDAREILPALREDFLADDASVKRIRKVSLGEPLR